VSHSRNPARTALAGLLATIAGLFTVTGIDVQLSERQPATVPVAARDLLPGTLLTRENLPELVIPKRLPKDSLPPRYVRKVEELVGKRITRRCRVGETSNPDHLWSKRDDLSEVFRFRGVCFCSWDSPPESVGLETRVDVLAVASIRGKDISLPIATQVRVFMYATWPRISHGRTLPGCYLGLALDPEAARLIDRAAMRGLYYIHAVPSGQRFAPAETEEERAAIRRLLAEPDPEP
jgi:hypothetical protein